jgi:GC-rich sequence DNA-binding factor
MSPTVPPVTPIPTLDAAIARLTQTFTTLTTSHSVSTTSLAALAQERLALDEREQELRTAVEAAEAKHSWFAAFQEWIETVATFLDEKV